jgi:predicted acylesterase/phospholipase RssA
MIDHLVLSGAGINILIQVGLLDYLIEHEIIQLQNIKHVYGTSAGAIISILLILGIPITEIREYIIHRPWEKFFDMNFLNINDTKGIITSDHLYSMIKPFMLAYDIPDTFTLLDLYNKSQIDLHVFTTKLNDMSSVDLNHIMYPNVTIHEAIAMSSSVPIIFTPVFYNGDYYIDGGILNHCPISPNAEHDTTLIINITANIKDYTHDTPLLEYINIIILKSLRVLSKFNQMIDKYKHYYEIKTEISMFDIQSWDNAFKHIEQRKKLYEIGYNFKKLN